MRIAHAKPFSTPMGTVGTLLLFLPWLVLLGWMAEQSWSVISDAFISFRYVRNLLSGHGLVYNPGEYVEGYSNFLWILELALLWGVFGLRPEQAAPWLSVAFTAGTIAVMLWWVARLPALRHRILVGWMALGLVCSSATFAVWTSAGGLETRQFTFFVVLAVVCLHLCRDGRGGLLAASLSLAAAALTRPEGPLIAVVCFGWFAMERMVVREGRPRLHWHEVAHLVGPFVVLIGAHFLFRHAYYGEWLPNTYYAKHIRPWYEAGFLYLTAAALETGLYILLPLAMVPLAKGWRMHRDLAYMLPLLLILFHMAYIARIGGDHFEYRPLDFYWPLLAVPAAAGIVCLGAATCGRLCRWARGRSLEALALGRLQETSLRSRSLAPAVVPWKVGVVCVFLFAPILFSSNAIQGLLLAKGAKISTFADILEDDAGILLAAPGMSALSLAIRRLERKLRPRAIAIRARNHANSADGWIRSFQPYEHVDWGKFPKDTVTSTTEAGIMPFYAYGLTVIDEFGLNDATVARNPVSTPNSERSIAHDRRPPAGYLEQRGVNIWLQPAVSGAVLSPTMISSPHQTRADVPCHYVYALRIDSDLWMPFNSADRQWVIDNFSEWKLRILDVDC